MVALFSVEMGEICTTCGLPPELCVCEDMSKSSSTVTVQVEERSYNKKVTIIEGFGDKVNIDDLATELKSSFGCGGTTRDSAIELQGDHRESVQEILEEHGIKTEE